MADVHRVRPDGTIKFNLRNQFISTTLAGELIGLYAINARFVQVVYAGIQLGIIDTKDQNINPRTSLLRPRLTKPQQRSTRLSAMSSV